MQQINFSEQAEKDRAAKPSSTSPLDTKIQNYIADRKKEGVTISYFDAYNIVVDEEGVTA